MNSLGMSPLPCGCWEYEVNGWPFIRGSEPCVVDRGSVKYEKIEGGKLIPLGAFIKFRFLNSIKLELILVN